MALLRAGQRMLLISALPCSRLPGKDACSLKLLRLAADNYSMGFFSQPKKKEYVLNRQCRCGRSFRIIYRYQPGEPPEIVYPRPRQCPGCGRIRGDTAGRRGKFDSRFERGYGSQFL